MKKNKCRLLFSFASILMVIYAIIEVSFAFALKYLIDSATAGNHTKFFQFLVISIMITLGEFLFGVLSRFYTLKYVKYNLESSKDKFYLHLLNKKYTSKIGDDTPDISMFSSNVDILYGSYYLNKVLIVNYIAKFVFAVYAVITLNWIVFVVAFLASAIPLVIPQIFKKRVRKSVDDYSSASKSYLDFISDSILGIDEIKAYNNQEIFLKKQINVNSIVEHARSKSKMVIYFVNMLSANFSSLTFLATIAVSGYFLMNGSLSIGTMIAIIQLLNGIVGPLVNISSAVNDINSAKNIVNKYNVKPIEQNHEDCVMNSFKNSITIDNLSYSYDSKNLVIDNFNFEFEKNKKYAIIGESGSGKSTLAKLIAGNINGYSGKILVDGIDLSTMDLKSYRDVCRYISQDPYVFKDTIKNNILFYDKEERNIDHVIKLFNLKNLIDNIGLNKIISDTDGISGGQKQRIILSRALLRESPILILDEPTANLDFKNTEEIVKELIAIENLTLIMVTHENNKDLLNLFDEVVTIN